MAAETRYRAPEETPSRDEIDHLPGRVLLEFGTETCGICHALAPRVSALLDQHPEVRHIKVEDGPGRPLGRSFHVRLWPNLVFLRDGAIVRQLARPGHDQLAQAFLDLLNATSGAAAGTRS
jgi:thioredoxin 1